MSDFFIFRLIFFVQPILLRGGQVEILQHNELQTIFGRNDILEENPCDIAAARKSQYVVRE